VPVEAQLKYQTQDLTDVIHLIVRVVCRNNKLQQVSHEVCCTWSFVQDSGGLSLPGGLTLTQGPGGYVSATGTPSASGTPSANSRESRRVHYAQLDI
jgi:hypothetical protein